MERKVGEKFTDLDEDLFVFETEQDLCFTKYMFESEKYCFYYDKNDDDCHNRKCGECSDIKRTDGKSVIFLKQNP